MAKLKEIVACAYSGCISEPEAVAGIVNRFVNLTFDEICQSSNMKYAECFEILTLSVDFPTEKLWKLNYTDIVSLTDNLLNIGYEGGIGENDSKVLRIFQIEYLKKILVEATLSVPIQMFLYLSVKAFYDYLETRHHNKLAEGAYKILVEKMKGTFDYEMDDKTTIYALLKVLTTNQNASWKPWRRNIENYEVSIWNSNDVVREVLIRSFQIGFRERCYVEDVIDKHMEEEEEMDYGKHFI